MPVPDRGPGLTDPASRPNLDSGLRRNDGFDVYYCRNNNLHNTAGRACNLTERGAIKPPSL